MADCMPAAPDAQPPTPFRIPDPDERLHSFYGHWLIFNDANKVVRCHCGVHSEMDIDLGYGDTIVDHLLAVGIAIGRGEVDA